MQSFMTCFCHRLVIADSFGWTLLMSSPLFLQIFYICLPNFISKFAFRTANCIRHLLLFFCHLFCFLVVCDIVLITKISCQKCKSVQLWKCIEHLIGGFCLYIIIASFGWTVGRNFAASYWELFIMFKSKHLTWWRIFCMLVILLQCRIKGSSVRLTETSRWWVRLLKCESISFKTYFELRVFQKKIIYLRVKLDTGRFFL